MVPMPRNLILHVLTGQLTQKRAFGTLFCKKQEAPTEGLPEEPEGLPEGPEGLPEVPEGLPEGPEGLPEGPESLPGGWGGDGWTDGRTDRISPHSTGLRPLSGPLPKKDGEK